ncbi:MAG: hypothetical protein JXL84_05380 [Deltaproteobacteria bacterium]|nr:hypothetical protein [Deltaproteobacteria bacterium]
MKKLLTGLEVSAASVKMAQIVRDRHAWKLANYGEVPFPEETLDVSNKDINVVNPESFVRTVRGALKLGERRVSRIGLALPNEILKISVYNFDELPKSKARIRDMIVWKEKEMMPYPLDKSRIAYTIFDHSPDAKKRVIAAICLRDIILDYETHLRRIRLYPETLIPSAISHLNLYLNQLPATGTHGFLGIFETYFSFFVIEDGYPSFYRGKRRQSHIVRFLQEISLTTRLYCSENPGKQIETLYLQSQVPLPQDFERDVAQDFDGETAVLEEASLLAPDPALQEGGKAVGLEAYAAAIGAAQSLVR